jgi:V8-like Glu-specific endopeptidase
MNRGAVTGVKVAPGSTSRIDFANAKAFALPQAPESVSVQAEQDLISNLVNRFQASAATDSGQVVGSEGDGSALTALELETPSEALDTQAGGEFESQEHGTSSPSSAAHPFSTARADLKNLNNTAHPTNFTYPYSPSGKLFFNIGSSTFVCSASLIKRGVVVTAAHCVAQFGSRTRFYTNFRFVPGYRNGVGNTAPSPGNWAVSQAWVMSSYINGVAGQCAATAPGVVCKDDVAVLELTRKTTSPNYPGTVTGWYGYGWNRFGFTSTGLTHITQTGYPGVRNPPSGLDYGELMQRNDSQGFIAGSSLVNNTVIGSLMTGGSSGGPWVLNFGIRPTLTGATNGSFSTPNIVVGVTSWGYISSAVKQQGASPFTSTNIVPLVNAACAGSDPRCAP